MKSKFALNEAVQVGPWRVARKHLLFVILFGLVIISFGIIILQTHVFDKEEGGGEEEEDEEEGDEEGDEEWGGFGERFSGGDWVMIAIMVASGLISLVAVFVCLLVKKNTPRRLSTSQRNASIYSVQFNNNDVKTPVANQSYAAPQPLPLWPNQLAQTQNQQTQHQEQQQQNQQPSLHQQQLQQQQNFQVVNPSQMLTLNPGVFQAQGEMSSSPNRSPLMAKGNDGPLEATAPPQFEGENPPPYTP